MSNPGQSTPPQPASDAPQFGDIVRRCRDELGVTQAEFGDLLGVVGQQQVGKWERGVLTSQPRHAAIMRLSEVCRIAPGELLAASGITGYPKRRTSLPEDPVIRQITEAATRLSPRQRRAILSLIRVMRDAS